MEVFFLSCFIVSSLLVGSSESAKPPAPSFTLTSTSPNSLTVSLTPPGISGIKGYQAQYSVVGGQKKTAKFNADTVQEITGLEPDTPYRMRISTKSTGGNGKYGPWVNGQTMSDAPPPPAATDPPPAPTIPESPQNLVADPFSTTAYLSWSAPPDNGVEILGYVLAYGPMDNPGANMMQLELSPTETTLEGLTSSTQHHVSMTAYNANGQSQPVALDFTTLEAQDPPSPVTNVQTNPSETSIEITWDLPAVTSDIDLINVGVGPAGTAMDALSMSSLAVSSVSYTAEQLMPGTSYTVAITTQGQNGKSEPVVVTVETSVPVVVTQAPLIATEPPPPPPTTPAPVLTDAPPAVPATPGTPQNLQVMDISTDSARITWDSPVDNGADMRGYVAAYGPMDNVAENRDMLELNPTEAVLDGLRPNTQYHVTLTTYNGKGQSDPITLEFNTEEERGPPPPVTRLENTATETSLEVTWVLPETTELNEIDSISFSFGPYGPVPVEDLPITYLEKYSTRHTMDGLAPGTSYTVMILALNAYGRSDPVIKTLQTVAPAPTSAPVDPGPAYGGVPPSPVELKAEVLTPSSVKVTFVDPTMDERQQIFDDRFYTLRYKREEDNNFQFLNVREIPYIVDYLSPESSYQFEVRLVLDRSAQSPFSSTVYAFTGESMVRYVTAVQIRITGEGFLGATINWIPPRNEVSEITGYVVEYTSGYYVTSRSSFNRVHSDGPLPTGFIDNMLPDTTYHVRVAPKLGNNNRIGRFSDPPEAFLTPAIPFSGQSTDCSGTDPEQTIIDRVSWMRRETRSALIGVPLPYCDSYYGAHECHGSVCFCIPGRNPNPACSSRGYQGDQPSNDDKPFDDRAPCRAKAEAARRAINDARRHRLPIVDVHLPHCRKDGSYEPKQCLGTMCYCTTRTGQFITGKEVPLWEAATLVC